MKGSESGGGRPLQRISLPFYIVGLTGKVSPAWLAATTGLAVLEAVGPLCNVWFSRILLDGLLAGYPWPRMILTGAVATGVHFLFQAGKRGIASVQSVFSEQFRDDFKCLAGERIMSMDYAMLESPSVMDLKERALRPIIDYGMLEQTLREVVPGILGGFFLLFATVMIALRSFPVLVLLLLILTFVNVWLMEWVRRVKNRTYQVVMPVERKTGSYNSVISDYSLGKDIRIYGMDRLLMAKLRRLNRKDLKAVSEQFSRISVGTGGSALLCHLQLLLVYGIFALWTMREGMSIGDYVFFTGIFLNLGTALSRITDKMSELLYVGRFFASFREFERIPVREASPGSEKTAAEQPSHGKESIPAERDISPRAPEICMKKVSFTYPGMTEPVLRELSLTLRRGERVAVVGKNGAGKTTLVKLLCGLYQPDEGEILLDGERICQGKESAAVFQDFRLYAFTIRENVTLGEEEGTGLKRCLEQAGLGREVEALPEGENSYLYKMFEKNGVELSGGNAQRLAIARAVYRDRGFLLMDEPTAALDPVAEEELFGSFCEISEGKTTLMISHRLSAALFCDRILVLQDGRIAEDGSHEELMGIEGGIYRKMYETQAEYYQRSEN